MLLRVRERNNRTCQGCGAPAKEVAHIVPWPDGPTDDANLRILCTSCNHKERRRWAKGHEGEIIPHAVPLANLRAIMERALSH